MSLQMTPSQTVGPFLHIGLPMREQMATEQTAGEKITIEGKIIDGNGAPVSDGVVEIWQANAHGKYAHPDDPGDLPDDPTFSGFGRSATDANGRFRFQSIKPGRVPRGDGTFQAPHIMVTVFMRGLLKQLVTRMYFPDDVNNAHDAVLQQLPDERRATLVGRQDGSVVTWNIVLQGQDETVFFDI